MTKVGLRSGVAIGALLIAAPAWAQDAPAPQTNATPSAEAPAVPDSDIVISGFRQSYADALRTKRDSAQITDSISSDGLGRFPDLNVGEAIQRIPGVQINREADGRAATISLRGLPGTFARTTLNGAGFADPILNGSTPLGAFNSDIFTSITVIKSPTAADLAGGLSGNIDLRIAPALSRKEGGFIKVSYEYNTLGKLGTPATTIGYNGRLSDNFAVFGVFAYKQEKFRRDSITVNSWNNKLGSIQVGNQAVPGSNPVYDALIAQYPGGIYYPSQTRQLVRFNSGNLFTGATGFEWKPTPTLKIGATGFYTQRNLDKSLNFLRYIDAGPGNNTNTALTATSAVSHLTQIGTPYLATSPSGQRAYINSFSAENINTFDSIRSEPGKQRTYSITPKVEFDNDVWRLNVQGTYSRAKVVSNQIELDIVQNPYRNLNAAGLNGITTSVYTGGTDLSGYTAVLNTPNASHIPVGGYPLPAPANAATQNGAQLPGTAAGTLGDRFGATGTNGMSENQLDAFQIDLTRRFEGNPFLSSLQIGFRYERLNYLSTGSRNTALGANTGAITQAMSQQLSYASDFFGGKAPGYSANWRTLDVNQVLAAITPVNTAPRSTSNPNGLPAQFAFDPKLGVFLTPYGLVNNYWDPNYYNNNFNNENKILSLYGMGNFDFKLGSVRISGNVGLRYERTKNQVNALDCANCSSTNANAPLPINHSLLTRTFNRTYDYWLPSAMFKAELTSKLVLRGAYYKTYVRPQPRDTTPITFVQEPVAPVPPSVVPTVSPSYTVTLGAPSLKPYTATSFDASLEWYNRSGSIIAIAAYQKNVKGYIGPITDKNVLCPADGRFNGIDYGLGALQVVGPNCRTTRTFINPAGAQETAVVLVTGNINQSPIRVRGLEFSIQQNFDFLPGFLKDFGAAANYSYTTISGTDVNGNKVTLPSVSKHNINLIGFYETKLFGVRVVFNRRGKYDLAAGNSFVGDARSVKARSQLDASATLNITKWISLSVDAFNLTDATRSEYESDPMLPRRIDYDGRTFQATIRASF
ncbi:TonB-dependent receptor [Sphingomonas panacisoli]|uniref:TonB-dependent receptor n=1 Tax=Sphingomonas panacisoli TaxID=1813879 RepID=A0A5B8LIC9_9SPHN|nr:TonB-dependent receptor [Sphingomonas panacisoli]QDZ07893.1 TonB-dependent receptor [Sphingomonas panacisoli]